MLRVRITTNAAQVAKRYKITPAQLQRDVIAPVVRDGLIAFSAVVRYPPPKELPTYTRTFTLARALQVGGPGNVLRLLRRPRSLVGEFGASLGYAPLVIGQGRQAWMHRGRWWTLEEKFVKFAPQIEKRLGERMTEYIGAR